MMMKMMMVMKMMTMMIRNGVLVRARASLRTQEVPPRATVRGGAAPCSSARRCRPRLGSHPRLPAPADSYIRVEDTMSMHPNKCKRLFLRICGCLKLLC